MSYYATKKLSGTRLEQCYAIAPPRIRQYFATEINTVLSYTRETDSVLELGCGYGRVTREISGHVKQVSGIDITGESIELARAREGNDSNSTYLTMDATRMTFDDASFDLVFCIQNGISAFGVTKSILIKEALRVTRPGGKVLFSSYSNDIWAERLKWFELQAEQGLVGEIDYDRTCPGTIVCKDGFHVGTLTMTDYEKLCNDLSVDAEIREVDHACVVCVITKTK